MKKMIILVLFAISFNCFSQNTDTVRVMYYNVLNYPGTTPERVELFRQVVGYAEPDVK